MKKLYFVVIIMALLFNSSLMANPLFKLIGKSFSKQATKQITKQTAKKLGKEATEAGLKIGLKEGGKVIAKNSEKLAYPLIKKAALESTEHIVTNPKVMQKLVVNFGDDAALTIMKNVPTSEMPMFLRYVDAADSPTTKKLFFECFRKEGSEIFKRVTPSMVLATGLSASMLYGTYRATTPMIATSESIVKSPEVANNFVNKFQDCFKDVLIYTLSKPILFITIILCLLILNRFGIFGKLYYFLKHEILGNNTDCSSYNTSKENIKPIIPVIYDSDSDRF